jgi:hypothetical protein
MGPGDGLKGDARLLADLTASIPRDVIAGAQQQWLPNLGEEMQNRPKTRGPAPGGWITTTAASRQATADAGSRASPARDGGAAEQAAGTDGGSGATPAKGTEARGKDVTAAAPPAKTPGEAPSAGGKAPAKAADQTDDLLFPTEEELRAIKAGGKIPKPAVVSQAAGAPAIAAPSGAGAGGASAGPAAAPQSPETAGKISPPRGIASDVDAESWAAFGGWYRQDHAIFYRPTGHRDKFMTSWLLLTARHASKGARSPEARIFETLTGKDAQGSCTKCHSVDDEREGGRRVNFAPASAESKKGRFTSFVHEPHLGILEPRGCLTCHSLEQGRPYLDSYQQGNPQSFASGFGAVKKELCQTCHNTGMARQDCLTCHKYHLNNPLTPMMSTSVPTP